MAAMWALSSCRGLVWQDGDLFFMVGGDVSPEQATAIAESLRFAESL